MGTYGLNFEEVADAMEKADIDIHCEGDFYEETFILGAIEYIRRLRRKGASIYSEKRKEIKKFVDKLKK